MIRHYLIKVLYMTPIAKLVVIINILAIFCGVIFFNYMYIGIILGVSAVVWLFFFLKKKQGELEANFQKRFSGKNIRLMDKYAVLKAIQSSGYSQTQGMGYLVLTDDELHFELSLLKKGVSIPASSIIRAGETKRLLGVGSLKTMLKVEFKDGHGSKDAMALVVKKTDLWKKEITEVIHECA